jgi:muramoyltetrapeptide carboxypeptidase
MKIAVISPSGCHLDLPRFDRACERLREMGHELLVLAPREPWQRFGGDDAARAKQIHDAARSGAQVVMLTRGGYGMVRLLPLIDWPLVTKAISKGQKWIGFSDFTVFQMALMAKTLRRKNGPLPTYVGPTVTEDFGAETLEPSTQACFAAWLRGASPVVLWDAPEGSPKKFKIEGRLWGGNLATLVALVGTPWFPKVKQGILWLEDVGVHPYQVERMLHQLHGAGILLDQQAIVFGNFSGWKPVPNDHGYDFQVMLDYWREHLAREAKAAGLAKAPLLAEGLPFGHQALKCVFKQGGYYQLHFKGKALALREWA